MHTYTVDNVYFPLQIELDLRASAVSFIPLNSSVRTLPCVCPLTNCCTDHLDHSSLLLMLLLLSMQRHVRRFIKYHFIYMRIKRRPPRVCMCPSFSTDQPTRSFSSTQLVQTDWTTLVLVLVCTVSLSQSNVDGFG